jgi:transposase
MARRGKKMTYEERVACVEEANKGKSDARIAAEKGWSVWAIRKWRRAYKKEGYKGLAPKMGRPQKGVLSTYSVAVSTEIEKMRREHPGWGPITLIEEMIQKPMYFDVVLPSRARVAAFLKKKGLVRPYERHVKLVGPSPEPVLQAHDEWEMDAQGSQSVDGLGRVCVLNILDVVSRLKVESYPHIASTKLGWLDYQLVLRSAFLQYGLPKQITLDHDSSFYDNTCLSPYPSRLHLWLVGLGIGVIFIKHKPPLEHAKIERGHQTMTAQAITGQSWSSQKALWQGLNQRRDFLNSIYPSRSLHYHAPLEACPNGAHSGREYRPEFEAELLNLNLIFGLLAQGRWFREANMHGELWLGMQRYSVGKSLANTTQEFTFDPLTLEFTAKTVGTNLSQRFPAKGLNKSDLMGELNHFSRMPSFQLMLPFTLEAWRHARVSQLFGCTTL